MRRISGGWAILAAFSCCLAFSGTVLAGPGSPPPGAQTPDPDLVLHVPVLMYHLVASPADARVAATDLVVSPSTFDAQLRALHDAGWQTITAAQLAGHLVAGTRPPARSFVITIDDGYANAYTNTLPILAKYGYSATFYIVVGRIGRSPQTLTWPEVREMLAAGMDIGNHTIGHPDLTRASDWDLGWQIRRAQEVVAAKTGYTMRSIAYPSGRFDGRVAAAVEKAGLTLGFTTQGGANETWAGRYGCPRIRMSEGASGRWLVGSLERWARG